MTLTQEEAAQKIADDNAARNVPVVDPLAKVRPEFVDLGRAYIELRKKAAHHRRRWSYYEGAHPLVFSTERLRQVFHLANVKFAENWCRIVVNSAADRMDLLRFSVQEKETSDVPEPQANVAEAANDPEDVLAELFENVSLGIEAADIHKETDITGEAFLVAWRNEGEEVEVYRQDARSCHMFYDPAQPRKKAYAAKWFDRGNKRIMVLYYPDRVEAWRSRVPVSELREFSDRQWEPDAGEDGDGSIPNPWGEVPVFHFRLGGFGESELDDAIPIQDMINKLISDLMVTGEFQAFPMRWAITNQTLDGLRSSPHGIWKLEPGDGEGQGSSTGQYPAADLGNFVKVIDNFAASMATITSTPKHLFFGAIGNPSGEALLALEAPLVNKVETYIERVGVVWREFARFVLRLNGHDIGRDRIEPIFGPVQTIQPFTTAQIRQTNVSAGMPLRSVLRLEGMSEADIAKIDEDRGTDELVKVKTPEQAQAEADAAIATTVSKLEPLLAQMIQETSTAIVAGMATSGTLAKLVEAGQRSRAETPPAGGSNQ